MIAHIHIPPYGSLSLYGCPFIITKKGSASVDEDHTLVMLRRSLE
jgi:hypothetical protein